MIKYSYSTFKIRFLWSLNYIKKKELSLIKIRIIKLETSAKPNENLLVMIVRFNSEPRYNCSIKNAPFVWKGQWKEFSSGLALYRLRKPIRAPITKLKSYAWIHFLCNSSENRTLEKFFPFSSNKISWSVGVILANINSPLCLLVYILEVLIIGMKSNLDIKSLLVIVDKDRALLSVLPIGWWVSIFIVFYLVEN
jgi:hypothetical protein